jgi:hypothetical protein
MVLKMRMEVHLVVLKVGMFLAEIIPPVPTHHHRSAASQRRMAPV